MIVMLDVAPVHQINMLWLHGMQPLIWRMFSFPYLPGIRTRAVCTYPIWTTVCICRLAPGPLCKLSLSYTWTKCSKAHRNFNWLDILKSITLVCINNTKVNVTKSPRRGTIYVLQTMWNKPYSGTYPSMKFLVVWSMMEHPLQGKEQIIASYIMPGKYSTFGKLLQPIY